MAIIKVDYGEVGGGLPTVVDSTLRANRSENVSVNECDYCVVTDYTGSFTDYIGRGDTGYTANNYASATLSADGQTVSYSQSNAQFLSIICFKK